MTAISISSSTSKFLTTGCVVTTAAGRTETPPRECDIGGAVSPHNDEPNRTKWPLNKTWGWKIEHGVRCPWETDSSCCDP